MINVEVLNYFFQLVWICIVANQELNAWETLSVVSDAVFGKRRENQVHWNFDGISYASSSFLRALQFFRMDLTNNEGMWDLRNFTIEPEVRVSIKLKILIGNSYLDMMILCVEKIRDRRGHW